MRGRNSPDLFTNPSDTEAVSPPSVDSARVNRAPIADICCEKDRRADLVSDKTVIAALSSASISMSGYIARSSLGANEARRA